MKNINFMIYRTLVRYAVNICINCKLVGRLKQNLYQPERFYPEEKLGK